MVLAMALALPMALALALALVLAMALALVLALVLALALAMALAMALPMALAMALVLDLVLDLILDLILADLVSIKKRRRMTRQKFELGHVVATPGALKLLEEHDLEPGHFISRHSIGDWGDTCPEDKELNEAALIDGSRIMSVYHLSKYATVKAGDLEGSWCADNYVPTVWVITEAKDDDGVRRVTTLLLPSEY